MSVNSNAAIPTNLPLRSRVSSSLKSEGTCTTTPEPMNATHLGLIRPFHQCLCFFQTKELRDSPLGSR